MNRDDREPTRADPLMDGQKMAQEKHEVKKRQGGMMGSYHFISLLSGVLMMNVITHAKSTPLSKVLSSPDFCQPLCHRSASLSSSLFHVTLYPVHGNKRVMIYSIMNQYNSHIYVPRFQRWVSDTCYGYFSGSKAHHFSSIIIECTCSSLYTTIQDKLLQYMHCSLTIIRFFSFILIKYRSSGYY